MATKANCNIITLFPYYSTKPVNYFVFILQNPGHMMNVRVRTLDGTTAVQLITVMTAQTHLQTTIQQLSSLV